MNVVMTAWPGVRAVFLAAALLATLPGTGAAQDKSITIKLATATLNDAQHEWMKRFAVEIDKTTNGRIKSEIYPASQLGAIARMIEGTQLGSIQIWVGPPEFLVGVDQRFELLSVPGLFQNDQQAVKTVADPEFSKAFLAIGANKGLVGASLFAYGPVAFAMRAPFRTLADLRGKKIRVLASPFQTEQIARLGATGIPLTLSDVLPALQQGTIDGTFSGLPGFYHAPVSERCQVHDRDRPGLYLQHRGTEQALVRRLAGRLAGAGDGRRQTSASRGDAVGA